MYVVCNFSGQLRFEICVRATRDSVMIHYCTGKFSLGFLSSKQMWTREEKHIGKE